MADIKYLNLNGTTYNITDNDAQEKIETLTTYIGEVKNAQGAEVGSTFKTNVSLGQLIWHNGLLYRTTEPISYNSSWDANKVVQTTIGDEINALRGVASETVVLTITPASAIPEEGVTVKIHNLTSDIYTNEITFTADDNRKTLGSIQYGDVYTIIMPEIDGYTQPADQTFQAGQILRDRTVNYISNEEPAYEELRIYLQYTTGSAVPESTVIVKEYDGDTLISTYNLTTSLGWTESINIPIGRRYTVTVPTLSGYVLVTSGNSFTAKYSIRRLRYRYTALSSQFYWILSDGTYVSGDTDPYTLSWSDIVAIASNLSSLIVNGVNYNFILEKKYLYSNLQGYWMSPAANIAIPLYSSESSGSGDYNGESNTAVAADFVTEQAELGNTYTSVMKTAYDKQDFVINGVTQKCYLPAYSQLSLFLKNLKTTLLNIYTEVFGFATPTSGLLINSHKVFLCSTQMTNNMSISVSQTGGMYALSKTEYANCVFVATILQYENNN